MHEYAMLHGIAHHCGHALTLFERFNNLMTAAVFPALLTAKSDACYITNKFF